MKQTQHYFSAILIFICLFSLSGCLPIVAAREIFYCPSPSDPDYLRQAYITDSELLYLCGFVNNGRAGMEKVKRVFNLELFLEGTLDA